MTRAWLHALPVLPFLVPCLAIDIDFSFYPENARDCLYQAASDSECSGDTATDLNSCLCSDDTGFVSEAAACLGWNDLTDVGAVFKTMYEACDQTQTTLEFTEDDFKDAAESVAAAKVTATASSSSSSSSSTSTHSHSRTATATSKATSSHSSTKAAATTGHSDSDDNHGKGGGLSAGGVAGVAVGAAAAISAMGVLLFCLRRRWQQGGGQGQQPPEAGGEGYRHEISMSTYAPVDQIGEGGYYEPEQKGGWGGGASSRVSSYKPGSMFISEPTAFSVSSPSLGIDYVPYGSPVQQQQQQQQQQQLQQHEEHGLFELDSDAPVAQVHEMGPGR